MAPVIGAGGLVAMSYAPGPIGREEAHELARRELQNPIYHRDDPSPLDRVARKINDWLAHLINLQHGRGNGSVDVVVLIVLLVVVIAVIWWRLGAVRANASAPAPLLDDERGTARDHRSEAEQYAQAGDWPNAIRERLRGIARDLEERAILEHRPGRTADELATEAGAELPDHADALAAGVRIFDDVWYGGRHGDENGYRHLVELDERLASARPRPIGAGR